MRRCEQRDLQQEKSSRRAESLSSEAPDVGHGHGETQQLWVKCTNHELLANGWWNCNAITEVHMLKHAFYCQLTCKNDGLTASNSFNHAKLMILAGHFVGNGCWCGYSGGICWDEVLPQILCKFRTYWYYADLYILVASHSHWTSACLIGTCIP